MSSYSSKSEESKNSFESFDQASSTHTPHRRSIRIHHFSWHPRRPPNGPGASSGAALLGPPRSPNLTRMYDPAVVVDGGGGAGSRTVGCCWGRQGTVVVVLIIIGIVLGEINDTVGLYTS